MHARDLLGETPGRDKGKGAGVGWRVFRFQCKSDFCERRGGRKKDCL